MIRQLLPALIFLFSFCRAGYAQQFHSLQQIKSANAKVYFSLNNDDRAKGFSKQIDKAYLYFAQLLEFKPEVTLLILNQADWKKFASPQAVYGMPHFDGKNETLFVAAEDNPFWRSFIPPLEKLPNELARKISTTYTKKDGTISMQAFFDLLAIHELGHAFSSQKGINMQRNWMGELFVNILLHTYIAEKDPGLLPALTVFPQMVVAGGSSEFKFTSLNAVDQHYNEIASMHPKNYGWYQCRWHAAAADIYASAGKDIGKKIWNALLKVKERLNEEALVSFFENQVHPSLSKFITNWDVYPNAQTSN